MKFGVVAVPGAAFLVFLIRLELCLGISWFMRALKLPDAELKPWRPGARLVLTGVITSLTIFFTAAWVPTTGYPYS